MTSPPPSDKKPGGFVPPPPGYLPPGARGEPPPALPEPDPPEPEPLPPAVREPDPGPAPPARPEVQAQPAPEPEPAPQAEPAPSAPPAAADPPAAAKAAAPPPAVPPAKHASAPPAVVASASASQRLPRVAWLVAVPGVAALASAVLPWFAPTGRGVSIPKAYCLQAGRVGFLAPLAIVVAAVIVLGPRVGVFSKGQPTRRLDTDGLIVGGAGVAGAVVLGLTWLLLPSSYTFPGKTWDQLNAEGAHLLRGPQTGYLIAIAAAVLAIICGAVLLVAGRRDPQ